MDKYPHVNAAFINAIIKSIREEGTKQEACDYLQEQWNEVCVLRDEIRHLRTALATAEAERDKAQKMHDHLYRMVQGSVTYIMCAAGECAARAMGRVTWILSRD